MHILIDANAAASYYLPQCARSKRVAQRVQILFDSVRSKAEKHFIYIPNFCIAEVFGVFAKYAYGKWNRHIKKHGTIDKRVYESLIKQFRKDIHNGRFLYHYELSRYHVLGTDLIAPIDHYYQYYRRNDNVAPMGTFDHLIISMGLHLVHIHGPENVVVISADRRLTDILNKCRSTISKKTIKRLKLNLAEEVTGKEFSPSLFPQCLNLHTSTKNDFKNIFQKWPLDIGKIGKVFRCPGIRLTKVSSGRQPAVAAAED